MGVSGCGKTTLGNLLSRKTGLKFIDADFYHSEINKIKMKKGIPLKDSDREPWLKKINSKLLKYSKNPLILACSALKEKYRLELVKGLKHKIKWIFFKGDFELINKRLENRKNHFMSNKSLKSQFEILETPHYGIEIDISKKKEDILNDILQYI
jgi:6-phosphogluconate dehydrogenase